MGSGERGLLSGLGLLRGVLHLGLHARGEGVRLLRAVVEHGDALNSAVSLLVAAPALSLVSERSALAETAVILAILAAMLAVTFLVILGPRPEPGPSLV